MSAVKIKQYLVRKSGASFKITLPPVWVQDYGLKPGDVIEVYRDADGNLIVPPPSHKAAESGVPA